MTGTEYHLRSVINRWCGATPDKYVPTSNLRDIWAAHIPQVAYEPEGIRRLFECIYSDPVFKGCNAAHSLRPGEFAKGGDVQAVRQLYARLLPCEPAAVSPDGEAMFK